jgi:hypothetical protein
MMATKEKRLYHAIYLLVESLEHSAQGKRYDTKDYGKVCPVCGHSDLPDPRVECEERFAAHYDVCALRDLKEVLWNDVVRKIENG